MSSVHPNMLGPGGMGPGESMNVFAGVVVSLTLHGIVILGMVWATMSSNQHMEELIEPKMLEFEDVELLALGEEKPPEALPRIANPAPKPVQPDEVALQKPDAVPLKKKKPKKEEEKPPPKTKEDRRKNLLDSLDDLHDPNRPTNNDVQAGHASGTVGGTLSDAAKANLLGGYNVEVKKAISRVWTVPSTITPAQIKTLQNQVKVAIYLSETGYIRRYKWISRSPNEQFNLSIESVLRRFQVDGGGRKMPLPKNEEVRQLVLKQPLNLKTWEYTGN